VTTRLDGKNGFTISPVTKPEQLAATVLHDTSLPATYEETTYAPNANNPNIQDVYIQTNTKLNTAKAFQRPRSNKSQKTKKSKPPSAMLRGIVRRIAQYGVVSTNAVRYGAHTGLR
jgi:hypothetical protein